MKKEVVPVVLLIGVCLLLFVSQREPQFPPSTYYINGKCGVPIPARPYKPSPEFGPLMPYKNSAWPKLGRKCVSYAFNGECLAYAFAVAASPGQIEFPPWPSKYSQMIGIYATSCQVAKDSLRKSEQMGEICFPYSVTLSNDDGKASGESKTYLLRSPDDLPCHSIETTCPLGPQDVSEAHCWYFLYEDLKDMQWKNK